MFGGRLLCCYIGGMISITQIATAIEAARSHALPGKEAVTTTDLMYQLWERSNNERDQSIADYVMTDTRGTTLRSSTSEGVGAARSHPRTWYLPMELRAEDCVTRTNQFVRFCPKYRRVPMSHAKQASTNRKRSINAVPVLSIAGLSTSLASGASAAIGRPAADLLTPKTGMSSRNHSV